MILTLADQVALRRLSHQNFDGGISAGAANSWH